MPGKKKRWATEYTGNSQAPMGNSFAMESLGKSATEGCLPLY